MSGVTQLRHTSASLSTAASAALVATSAVYPAELFVLRRQVREKSKAPAAITKRAEHVAVQVRRIGVSHYSALNRAMAFLFEASHCGYSPKDCA